MAAATPGRNCWQPAIAPIRWATSRSCWRGWRPRSSRATAWPALLILTTFETDSQVIQALKAGASGYVLKDSSAAAIVSSIVAVMSGERVMASAVANRVLEMLTGTTTPKEFYDGLTNREIEILKLLANGMANKQIAFRLKISENTEIDALGAVV